MFNRSTSSHFFIILKTNSSIIYNSVAASEPVGPDCSTTAATGSDCWHAQHLAMADEDDDTESYWAPPSDAENMGGAMPDPEPVEDAEAAAGFAELCSDVELATCLRVLGALEAQPAGFLQSRRFRGVRSCVVRLRKLLDAKMYGGKPAAEYIGVSVRNQIDKAAKDRLRRKDEDKLRKTQLRAARLQRLTALQEEQQALPGGGGQRALSAVPDGAVETTVDAAGCIGGAPAVAVSVAELAAGVGARSSFAVRAGRRTVAAAEGDTSRPEAAGAAIELGVPEAAGAAGGDGERCEDADGGAWQLLEQEQRCYQCKSWFKQLHHFYAQLCPDCARLNWSKRHQAADLRGKVRNNTPRPLADPSPILAPRQPRRANPLHSPRPALQAGLA